MTLLIRRYEPSDAAATANVYQQAIRTTAAAHYDPAQINAWAGNDIDLQRWNMRRLAAWTVVAEVDGAIVGFSDLTPDGELDMLFVHPDAGGQGVARALVTSVLDEGRRRGLTTITTTPVAPPAPRSSTSGSSSTQTTPTTRSAASKSPTTTCT